IYPEQNIAVVNELVFPSGRPLAIRITSDTVMNSFIIPGLGGQIYAMAGMQTKLHLLADEPGEFWGRNVQYSGRGFADQQFRAIATSTGDDFDAWIAKVKTSLDTLDATTYEQLAKPSVKVPVTYYSAVEPNLFDKIIAKWRDGGTAHHAPMTAGAEQANCGKVDVCGTITIEAFPFYSATAATGAATTVLGAVSVIAVITYFRAWRLVLFDWISSLDHKKIGIMYVMLALVMLMRGFIDAAMMRSQQAIA